MPLEIRAVRESDRADVLAIARELVRSCDTYAFDPAVTDEELWLYWAPPRPGRGFGRRMGEASLELAAGAGYRALQFNIVVGTNAPALKLWRSLGFEVVGTVPEGFRLPDGRYVEHHILHRRLSGTS